jgi:hypothetical protein
MPRPAYGKAGLLEEETCYLNFVFLSMLVECYREEFLLTFISNSLTTLQA